MIVLMGDTYEQVCDSCRNGPEDLCSWDRIEFCDCCGLWQCDICYSWMHPTSLRFLPRD